MESDFSALSSMSEQLNLEDIAPGLYNEANRLALYALLNGGPEAYQEFLKAEGITDFLSEEEIRYILEKRKWPSADDDQEDLGEGMDNAPSTYCPLESDVEVPDLDLGWPEARLEHLETSVRTFFHPPRQNMPSIKTLVRKYIREAKMVIAIAMDIFTDVDIFRDLVEVSTRGVVVYVLLDELQFNSFFRMSEKANVPLQKLWNVRVRTVKGHEYRCQSGAKFHGAMEQKFMLVDCHTVLYGSYSFMWSYEKINLSMALLITGRLVACYDEEFRRLFARSIIPASLSQLTVPSTDLNSPRNPGTLYSLHSAKFFERSRSLDPTQLRSIRGRVNILNNNDKQEEGTHSNGPTLRHGLNLQRYPTTDLVKQNNYTSLQQRMYTSMLQRSISASGQFSHQGLFRQPAPEDNSLQGQQSFLSASELSLHKWRIESYLTKDHIPADSTESLDCLSTRCDSKSSLLTSHSSRPNLIFKTPEQPAAAEVRPMQSPYLGRRTITSVYSSLQRAKDADLGKDFKKFDLIAERKLSEEPTTSPSRLHLSGLVNSSTMTKHPPPSTDQPSLPETNHQSVPETKELTKPVTNTSTTPKPSSLHSSKSNIATKKEEVAEALKEEIHAPPKLTESHRSISHYDIKTVDDKKSYDWQEPPSKTTSVMNLGQVVDSSIIRGSNLKRLRPFSDSNTTRLSLLEIPEEKETLGSKRNLEDISQNKDTTSAKPQHTPVEANVHIASITGTITSPSPSCTSGDTSTPQVTSPAVSRPMSPTWMSSGAQEKSATASPRTLSALDVVGDTHHRINHGSVSSVATVESVMSNPDSGRFGIAEVKRNKVYSRFEHFLSVERKSNEKTETDRMNAYAEKRRSLFIGAPASYPRYQIQNQTDNRFGKFIQRMGSFINKNK